MGLLLHVCALNDNCVRLLWGDDLCARAPVGAFAATAARRDRPGGSPPPARKYGSLIVPSVLAGKFSRRRRQYKP